MDTRHKSDDKDCRLHLLALRDSLELLGGKWSLLLIIYLGYRENEALHFKRIQRELAGISAKVLTKELKSLEANHIIVRTTQPTKPVTVTYSLTEYGKTLVPIARALQAWGLNHRQVIAGRD